MKRSLVFLLIGFIFYVSCSAQNVNAQTANNDVQRIVGTWTESGAFDDQYNYNISAVFTANGSYTITTSFTGGPEAAGSGGVEEGLYMVSNSKIILNRGFTRQRGIVVQMTEYDLSANGRILVFNHNIPVFGHKTLWLNKQ